jgi:hypothetical protein
VPGFYRLTAAAPAVGHAAPCWGVCLDKGALPHFPAHYVSDPADRDMLKLTQQEFTGLPQQLHLELLVSITLCLIGEAVVGLQYQVLQLRTKTAIAMPRRPARPAAWHPYHVSVCAHGHLSAATCSRLPSLRQHEADRAQQRTPVSVSC